LTQVYSQIRLRGTVSKLQWYHKGTGATNYHSKWREAITAPSQNLSNVEVPIKVLLHGEADEPSYTSNIIPSATASRVEEDIVEMHKIYKDLQSQMSSLSLEVEEERSQRIQIKAVYETQLEAVTSKYELELESILNKIHNTEVNQAKQHQLICNQIHEFKFMGEQESTIVPASMPFSGVISTMPVPKTLRSTNEVLQQANTQIHTVTGLSYDTVNFPLLDEVATKYKSFEVP
jgi:hypothetical protein